jgi:hypothetical protein
MEIKMENEKIIKKWRPVIEQFVGIKNNYLINTICIFCENYSLRESKDFTNVSDYNSNLPEKLKEIISKLNNLEKIEIVKSYYNPFTGLIEHELKNGLKLDENMNIQDMDEEKFIHFFGEIGIEILRETDPVAFREKRLNEVLK